MQSQSLLVVRGNASSGKSTLINLLCQDAVSLPHVKGRIEIRNNTESSQACCMYKLNGSSATVSFDSAGSHVERSRAHRLTMSAIPPTSDVLLWYPIRNSSSLQSYTIIEEHPLQHTQYDKETTIVVLRTSADVPPPEIAATFSKERMYIVVNEPKAEAGSKLADKETVAKRFGVPSSRVFVLDCLRSFADIFLSQTHAPLTSPEYVQELTNLQAQLNPSAQSAQQSVSEPRVKLSTEVLKLNYIPKCVLEDLETAGWQSATYNPHDDKWLNPTSTQYIPIQVLEEMENKGWVAKPYVPTPPPETTTPQVPYVPKGLDDDKPWQPSSVYTPPTQAWKPTPSTWTPKTETV